MAAHGAHLQRQRYGQDAEGRDAHRREGPQGPRARRTHPRSLRITPEGVVPRRRRLQHVRRLRADEGAQLAARAARSAAPLHRRRPRHELVRPSRPRLRPREPSGA